MCNVDVLFTTMDGVYKTIENGYLEGKKVDDTTLLKIKHVVRCHGLDYLKKYPEAPRTKLIEYLYTVDIPKPILRLALGLTENAMAELEQGKTYPYLNHAYDAIFSDLDIKNKNMLQGFKTTKFNIKDCMPSFTTSKMQAIIKATSKKFKSPEEFIIYLNKKGCPIEHICKVLHTTRNTIHAIRTGNKLLPYSAVVYINRIFNMAFDKPKKLPKGFKGLKSKPCS